MRRKEEIMKKNGIAGVCAECDNFFSAEEIEDMFQGVYVDIENGKVIVPHEYCEDKACEAWKKAAEVITEQGNVNITTVKNGQDGF